MAEDHQDKEHLEGCCGYCEKVDREDIRRMVLQKSSPCLRWWLSISDHVLGHYGLRHIDTELHTGEIRLGAIG